MTNDALKSELRESAIIMANLPIEFGVACITEAGAQRIAKVLTDAATALPEPSSTAYIQGHSGGEYRTLSDSYEPDCAMFSPQQMHAYLDADRASSCAAQAAPFAKDSWQHAVDNQLVAFGRTSQEFANPHEALAWLAIVNMELGQSNVGAAQAVRVLTREDIDDVRKTLWRDAQMNLSDLHAEDAAKAFQRKFCEVNGLTVKDQS